MGGVRVARWVLVVSVLAASGLGMGPLPAEAQTADPVISAGRMVVAEPGPGTATAVIVPLTLDRTAVEPVTVGYETVDVGSAVSTGPVPDYVAKLGGVATIPAGKRAASIRVVVRGDRTPEDTSGPEWFMVRLTDASHAKPGNASGEVAIRDRARTSGLAVADAEVIEGDVQTVRVAVTVSLAAPQPSDVAVDWATNPIGAGPNRAGPNVDFLPASGTAVIPAGSTSSLVEVYLRGDTLTEPREASTSCSTLRRRRRRSSTAWAE